MRRLFRFGASLALACHASVSMAQESLRSPSDFASIEDQAARSAAIFMEAGRVITGPRCMNCHPATRSPTQGDDLHPHVPPVMAGESGLGVPGLQCSACHGSDNLPLRGASIGSVPGNDHWRLAPPSMAWQGLSVSQICDSIKDRARNGNRSLADIKHHLAEDPLVGWAWDPGQGRNPAPGTQKEFGALIEAWIETGAACPKG